MPKVKALIEKEKDNERLAKAISTKKGAQSKYLYRQIKNRLKIGSMVNIEYFTAVKGKNWYRYVFPIWMWFYIQATIWFYSEPEKVLIEESSGSPAIQITTN